MGNAQAWLTGDRDYYDGLKLLREHGASGFMLELLEAGPDEYNTPKLLQEINSLPIEELQVTIEATPAGDTPEPPVTYVRDKNLEKTIRIKEQIKQLYKEIGHLKPQLVLLPEGPTLYECAKLILEKDLRKQDLWEHLHYYETNNHWFDELPENQPKPYDLEKTIKNAMANRSKASAYLDTPLTAARKAYYETKVADWTGKIENLRSLR